MDHHIFVFAYVGPDTMLPVVSGLAGLTGFVMMFGRRAWDWAARRVPRLTRKT
jgi:hypothetical protein